MNLRLDILTPYFSVNTPSQPRPWILGRNSPPPCAVPAIFSGALAVPWSGAEAAVTSASYQIVFFGDSGRWEGCHNPILSPYLPPSTLHTMGMTNIWRWASAFLAYGRTKRFSFRETTRPAHTPPAPNSQPASLTCQDGKGVW